MIHILKHLYKIIVIARRVPDAWLLITLQLASGVAGVVGLPLLIPILKMLEGKTIGQLADPILNFINKGMVLIGIEPSFHSILATMSFLVIGSIMLDASVVLLGQFNQYQLYADSSIKLLNGYLHVRWPWMVKHHSGEMNHALYNEAAAWSETVFQSLRLIATTIQAVSYLIVALYVSWKGSFAAAIVLAVLITSNLLLSQRIKTISSQKNTKQKEFAEFVQTIQQNRKFLKSSMLYQAIKNRYNGMVEMLVRQARGMAWRTQIQRAWAQSCIFLILVSLLVFHKSLHLGYAELIVLFAAFTRMLPQITAISADYAAFASKIPVYEALEERTDQLEAEKEVYGSEKYISDSVIRFEHVNFSYSNGRQILLDLNLEIPPNKTVAIIGVSGEGKSTILDLLLGLWQPESGTIRYGMVSHKALDYKSFRSKVAYVSQETTLFSGTFRENLLVGSPDGGEEHLNQVLDVVQLSDMVQKLPDGLETLVGENGIRMSVGQRQRVGLARSLLMQPEILILDEATSALDLKTEGEILDVLFNRLHHKMTILIVTHRASTVKYADYVYVLEDGRVMQRAEVKV
ncbi:MAG: hypothetical protein A2Y81_00960 [Nitrospirae bacterium RBG_13_43_8]|nr:MAG: hypothetical protein A2Y81_00960 [Nitrospirae bacterium RBG_13_43_8]